MLLKVQYIFTNFFLLTKNSNEGGGGGVRGGLEWPFYVLRGLQLTQVKTRAVLTSLRLEVSLMRKKFNDPRYLSILAPGT